MRTLKFTQLELASIKDLILNKIDSVYGFENLSTHLQSVLEIINSEKL